MPNSRHLRPCTRAWRRPLLALAGLALLAGCGMQSDFGEMNRTLVRDDIHDWVGRDDVAGKAISPSSFELTDDERQLRDLAFPLIEPPYDRQNFDQVGREYGLIRTKPREAADRTAYFTQLMKIADRSPAARYAQLNDDIRNDSTRLPQFFETAGRVQDMDQKRRKGMAFVSGLGDIERKDTLNRIRENDRVIAQVRSSLTHRASGYRFALERMVIMAPSPQAVDTERMLNHLQAEIARYRNHPAPTWSREQSLAFQR
ncbi:MAG: hypothetical protein PSV22_12380 [Pseudolabrys sp.]|nr:hypothetical protein [Pseudolabrys sp.]